MVEGAQLLAGVYARQSRNKAKSITEQVDAGVAVATEHGWALAERYADGSSASRYARKGRDDWARVLTDIKAGRLTVLVLWESSRGDRTLTSWSQLLDLCRERGVKIYVISDERLYDPRNQKDWRNLANDGVASAAESDLISLRVRRGHAGAAADGKPSHGRCPYGYRRVYDPATGKLVGQEPDPDTAPYVQEIVRQVARGVPVSVITKALNNAGAPTISGAREWYRQRIRDVATNPAYIGVRVYNGAEYPATWSALVDRAAFYAARRVLGDPGRTTTKPGRQKHLLSYLALAPCGAEVCAVRGRYRCTKDGCVTIVQADADDVADEDMIAILSKPDVYEGLRRAGDDADRAVLAAEDEAAELRDQLGRWRTSAAKGKTTPESLAVIETDLTAQIRDAELRAKRAAIPPALRDVLEPGEDVRTRWFAAPLAARRELIRTFATVHIHKAARPGSREFEPERVELVPK